MLRLLTQGMYIYRIKSKTVDVLPTGNIRCDIIRARFVHIKKVPKNKFYLKRKHILTLFHSDVFFYLHTNAIAIQTFCKYYRLVIICSVDK